MQRAPALLAVAISLISAVSLQAEPATSRPAPSAIPLPEFFQNYCTDCHSGSEPEANLDLEQLGGSLTADNHAIWQKVQRMLAERSMPPEDMPQPEGDELLAVSDWIDHELRRISYDLRWPGRVTLRRLNRAEYNNTVRDLLGVELRPADDFPSDDVGAGFDNIGAVLSLPPILMEKYLDAAEKVVDATLANPDLKKRLVTTYPDENRSPGQALREVLRPFVTRAFRRPVASEELERLLALADQAESYGADYEMQLRVTLQAVLVSPHFLYRVEKDPEDPHGTRELDAYEVATRLSYFLWSSMPDDELFQLAADDKLKDREVLRAQIDRMLKDPKSQALVKNFAGQWLQLRNLAQINPDPERFDAFDEELRQAMLRETELFFEAMLHEDRSVLDFLDADFSFLNERLAKHYGIEGVEGSEFRRVSLPPQRRGVLTHASILTLTSNPTRTSPVKRGKWILDNILGTPPPPPPPGVEELSEEGEGELLGSLRERTEQHRANPTCASCHQRMDPLGFGLENFDAVGRWRNQDGQFPIDASGVLPDGQAFDGPSELMNVLKTSRQEDFCRCLAEKMLTYALGRELENFDRYAVEQIIDELEKNDYRFSSLVLAIVTSEPFRMRGGIGGKP